MSKKEKTILLFEKAVTPPAADLELIQALVKVVDTSGSMVIVQDDEAKIAGLMKKLVGWTSQSEKTYVAPDMKKKVLDGEYVPEASVSGVEKNFVIRCAKCRWARMSSGVSSDLADLNEIKSNCKNCGKWRKFKCPKCGVNATMKRISGNSPAKGNVNG
jgi:hypothetical protein